MKDGNNVAKGSLGEFLYYAFRTRMSFRWSIPIIGFFMMMGIGGLFDMPMEAVGTISGGITLCAGIMILYWEGWYTRNKLKPKITLFIVVLGLNGLMLNHYNPDKSIENILKLMLTISPFLLTFTMLIEVGTWLMANFLRIKNIKLSRKRGYLLRSGAFLISIAIILEGVSSVNTEVMPFLALLMVLVTMQLMRVHGTRKKNIVVAIAVLIPIGIHVLTIGNNWEIMTSVSSWSAARAFVLNGPLYLVFASFAGHIHENE